MTRARAPARGDAGLHVQCVRSRGASVRHCTDGEEEGERANSQGPRAEYGVLACLRFPRG